MEYYRQPCPIRVVEDVGCGFLIGSIGGGLFHYVKGFRDAPAGLSRSLYGGLLSVKMKTPAMAGNFAVWAAAFGTVDCALVHYRKREDSWNSVLSGAASGAILAARQGVWQMANGAFMGFLVLGLIEGISAAMATISAAEQVSPITLGEAQVQPKRAEWDVVLDPEFELVLDKCQSYKDARMGTASHSLSDLVKMANVV